MMNIERYQLIEQLGAGSVGAVYRARDPLLQREVALKWLHEPPPAGTTHQQFLQQTRQIAELGHPHIVPVYELGQHEGRPFLAMRYLSGGPLEQHLPMDLATVLEMVTPIADALDTAHDLQIFHNHLSPANILLDEAGQAYLSDFGLGHFASGGLPAYQPPEQAAGAAGDQYSLAVIIFEALTGRLPFPDRNTLDTLASPTPPNGLEATQVNLNHVLPMRVNLALQKALLPEPSARYDSCLALLKAVYEAAGLEVPAGIVHSGKAQKELEQFYQTGLAAMSAGRLAEAIAAFDQVRQIDPDYRNVKRLYEVVEQGINQPASPKPTPPDQPDPTEPEIMAPPNRRLLWLAAGLMLLAIVAIGLAIIPNLLDRPAGATTIVTIISPTPTATTNSGPTATLALAPLANEPTSEPTATPLSLPAALNLTVFQAGGQAKLVKAGQNEEQPLQAGQNLALEDGLELLAGDEPLILLLPDNSKLSLDSGGSVRIVDASEVGIDRLQLVAGRLLVSLDEGQQMVVELPAGDNLTVYNGPAGILLHENGSWETDCFMGPCVVTAGQAVKSLRQCQQARITNGTIIVASQESQPASYFFSLFAPITCPLPTLTPSPSATPTPTRKQTPTNTPTPTATTNNQTPTSPAGTPQPSPTQPPATSPSTPTQPPAVTAIPTPTPTKPAEATPTLPPPPTATHRPPTNTPAPPTNTPEPPTVTPDPNPTRTPGPTDPPPPTNTPRSDPTETRQP